MKGNLVHETEKQPILFTEVGLRDGEQQEKRYPVMPVEDRIAVFDNLVDAGMRRIEIGHLGNPADQELASALVEHIDEKSATDQRYNKVELQVLFGSQQELIEEGLDALGAFDKDRVVVHVYDRFAEGLRALGSENVSAVESADRVVAASQLAINAGFRKFSISGEGAMNHYDSLGSSIGFYVSVLQRLEQMGATEINVNLADTYGLSAEGEWGKEGLKTFNDTVKTASRLPITTSMHVHNDANSATEVALTAVAAGFDRVEGTMFGMGERAGNVALADVMVRLIEKARTSVDIADVERVRQVKRVGSFAAREIWSDRKVPPEIVSSLGSWYQSCSEIAEIYDTTRRFEKTSLGNPEAYDAGSGPHAHANQEFLKEPFHKPLWKNYGSFAIVHAMLGRPDAQKVIEADEDRIKQITLATHAAGGSTERVLADEIMPSPLDEKRASITMAEGLMQRILIEMAGNSEALYAHTNPSQGVLANV